MVNVFHLQSIHTLLFTQFIFILQEHVYSVQWTVVYKILYHLPAKSAAEAEAITLVSLELHLTNFPHSRNINS